MELNSKLAFFYESETDSVLLEALRRKIPDPYSMTIHILCKKEDIECFICLYLIDLQVSNNQNGAVNQLCNLITNRSQKSTL
jgi:hypothetical protein